MQEIEVKFRLDCMPPPGWIREILTLWGGMPGEVSWFSYRDLYWDTPARTLARHRLALRLRLARRAVWTLKGGERVLPDRVIRREEEVPVPYREALRFLKAPDPRDLPPRLKAMLPPLDRLEVVVDLVGERGKQTVVREGEVGVFHREEVWVGTERGIFLEMEGPDRLVRSFSHLFSRLTGLHPEGRSKLAWALERTQPAHA